MSKKLEKYTANLERLSRKKISTIQRIVLEEARPGGSAMNPQVRSRKIETAVFESVQGRKALTRFRRIQAKRLKTEQAGR